MGRTPKNSKQDQSKLEQAQLQESEQPRTSLTSEAKPTRLLSLDAFRGLTIALMLLVNNTAVDYATPAQLTHAPWNGGIRLADYVFPWFLFCVGAAIPYSWASFRRTGLPTWKYDLKALRRAALLVLLGCIIDSSISKRPLFDLGVLQLIGLAYLVGAVLYALPKYGRLAAAGALLVGYWALIKFVPIPGVGAGVFEEQQNIILHINRTYLANYNLSGLLSVMPTAAMVLIATAIGDLLKDQRIRHAAKFDYLTISGLVMIVAGSLWHLNLPFNKPFWTPSYILFTAGAATVVLGLFYLIVDAKSWRWWAFPLLVFGSNAIVAYVAPIIVKIHVLQEWSVPTAGGKWITIQQWALNESSQALGRVPGGWLYTAVYIVAWWLILWVLYRKKMFLKI